ncbi:MAG: class I SAM-dependent methyltransferase [Candidatus Staskawiczbacteria bacterium]|nr:class I SAM-dependent methyltransferase [Candidatus Staskawiczbacteria bacterium]
MRQPNKLILFYMYKIYKDYQKINYKIKLVSQDLINLRNFLYSQYIFIAKKVKPESDVFEIGSGIGAFYSLLPKEIQNTYLGIDLDKDAVNFANKILKTKSFIYQSLEDFGGTKKFKTIYAFEVLEHLQNPKNQIKKIFNLL